MTPEEARLNLDACTLRPADAGPEAHAIAGQDPDLGQWLDKRKAFDEMAAEAFVQAPIPEGLNHRLLAAMMAETSAAPSALPEEKSEAASISGPSLARYLPWLGLAALLTLYFGGFWGEKSTPDQTVAESSVQGWRGEAISVVTGLQSGTLPLDEFSAELGYLKANLAKSSAPLPDHLPRDLTALSTLGCKVIRIGGRPASVVCFDLTKAAPAHLITFSVEGLQDAPVGDAPEFAQIGKWQVATWKKGGQGYFLATVADSEALKGLFVFLEAFGDWARLV